MLGINSILIEAPSDWASTDVIAPGNRKFIEVVADICRKRGFKYELRSKLRGSDFAPVYAKAGQIVLSVHSVGVANGVARVKESYLPGYYYFDRVGYSGWSEITFSKSIYLDSQNLDMNYAKKQLSDVRELKKKNNISKYKQNKSKSSHFNENGELKSFASKYKRTIFLPLQTLEDYVALMSYIPQTDLLRALPKICSKYGIGLVIKRHPYCSSPIVQKALEEIKKEYKDIYISTESVNEILDSVTETVTVNSTVGFESLIMGVRTIVAGRCDYESIALVARDAQSLEEIIRDPVVIDQSKIDRFIIYFLENYCVNANERKSIEDAIERWSNYEYWSHSNLSPDCFNVNLEIQEYLRIAEISRRQLQLGDPLRAYSGKRIFSELVSRIPSRLIRMIKNHQFTSGHK